MGSSAWPPGDDPALRAAATRARSEWRDEQEQVALDAAIVRRHSRTVRDRLRDAMARGDHVTVHVDECTVSGTVIEVDDDLVSLRDPVRGRVDVRLDPVPHLVLRVLMPAARPGCTPPLPSGGFRGRVLAAEANATRYAVRVRGMPEPVEGRVEVGLDHLDIVNENGTTTIPFTMIVSVSSSTR